MVTIDTSDGISMRCAYGWAFLKPIRKIYYNLTITIISVLVAFAIGGIEFIQVLASEFGWTTGFWSFLGNLDFETMGYAIIAIFLFHGSSLWLTTDTKDTKKPLFQQATPISPAKLRPTEISRLVDAIECNTKVNLTLKHMNPDSFDR